MTAPTTCPPELSTILSERYELLHGLGQGAYGTVLKAIQKSTGQPVAIKIQRLNPGQDGQQHAVSLARFERETQLCAALNHPHIVRVIDKGQSGDWLFIIFEFVPGETLAQLLAREGAMPPFEAVALMAQVLDALNGAHSQGIIHRDLKPDNIMVVSTGAQPYVKVLDFGVGTFIQGVPAATLTRSHDILGTPCYSAPEQLRGEPATPKSDIYAWALVLLECLTGQRVMSGATMAQVFQKQLSAQEIPLPSAIATHGLGALLRRALVKSPRERASDAGRLWLELRRVRVADLVHSIVADTPAPIVRTAPLNALQLSGEQRQVTAFCCTLNIAPDASHPIDAETSDAIHRDQLTLCSDVATRFGGHLVGVLANRVLSVFGFPTASDGDARRAARAALELASRIESRRKILSAQRGIDLELRVGLHTDVAIINPDGTPSGPALNIASCLESLAQPGTTLVSEATRNLLHKQLQFRPVEAALFANTASSMRVYSLVSEGVSETLSSRSGSGNVPSLIGRAAELKALLERWESAQSGRGKVVLLRGEPGVGKSRLVQEMRARALGDKAEVLDCQCLPEDGTTALHPVMAMIRRHFELDGTRSPAALARLERALAHCGLGVAELLPVFCAWLSLPEVNDYAPLQISGQRQRELLLDAIAKLLCTASSGQGSLVVLEDLHWADPTTRELVTHVTALAPNYAVFVLLTARPEFANPVDGIDVTDLHGLERTAAEGLITQAADGATLDPDLIADIVERTDGIPLFIEELTRSVLESGQSSSARVARDSIPTTLRHLLHSRLDRLGQAKETAQLAAAIGREFETELLAIVSLRTVDALQADLGALVDAQLIRRHLQSSGMKYVFRHALIRDAAWDSMLTSQRMIVHRRIAEGLQNRRGDPKEAEPARLARHYELAGLADKAIDQHLLAGQQAAQASAYREAVDHLQTGLALLPDVLDPRERESRELDLCNALGGLLIATQGFATPAVIDTFTRARDLLKRSTPTAVQRFATLKGLWTFHNARASYATALEIAEELLGLAADLGNAEFHLGARECACQTSLLIGNFQAAVRHSSECEKWFDATLQRKLVAQYGDDPWLVSLSFECSANTLLGRIGRARSRVTAMLQMADDLGLPNPRACMLGQGAWVELLLGSCGSRPNAVLDLSVARAQKAVEIAGKFGFPFWENYGRLIIAMATSIQCDRESVRALERGIELWRLSGVEALLSWVLAFLASGQHACGDYEAALASASEALRFCAHTGEDYGAAEAHRVFGLVVGDPRHPQCDRERAAKAFEESLAIARRQEARFLELRTAYTFAEQTMSDGNEVARDHLCRAVEWFQNEREALDTPLMAACTRLLR